MEDYTVNNEGIGVMEWLVKVITILYESSRTCIIVTNGVENGNSKGYNIFLVHSRLSWDHLLTPILNIYSNCVL